MKNLDELKLGKSSDTVDLTTSEENREASLVMARQARLNIEIVSRHLDPAIYDQQDFVEAVKQLALSHQRARIRILVLDAEPLFKSGHRLLTLAGRISSFIELRSQNPQFKDLNQAYMAVDETGYIFRELSDRYEGVVNFNDPAQARYFTRNFDKMWEISVLDPNLRQMKL